MHGIKKVNSYWRHRKVKEAFLEATDITPIFVELPTPMLTEPIASADSKIVAILKGKNYMALEITNQASTIFLNALLGAMNTAQ